MEHFTFFVIGGGSGGIAAARRAVTYGVSVGIAEGKKWGGTCVNVGCVPKKMLWFCSNFREVLKDAQHYGYSGDAHKFSWSYMKKRIDLTINRLNGIYENSFKNAGITRFFEYAEFSGMDNHLFRLKVGEKHILASHVLIATGSVPKTLKIPGHALCITSDEFFSLEELPKKVAIIGAGYIATELAGVLSLLGSETHVFTRKKTVLSKLDHTISNAIQIEMAKYCIMHPNSITKQIDIENDLLKIILKPDEIIEGFDKIIVAIGRVPNLQKLKMMNCDFLSSISSYCHIPVDEYQNTSVRNLYALGDVCGKVKLTPMAIAAGRRLADRLFGKILHMKADYTNVPTVYFTHPPIGTIGMTEREAMIIYGNDAIKIYSSTFVDLYFSPFDILSEEKQKTFIKLICLAKNGKILGLHILGRGADEMLQGFAVAIKMGATKADFDNCIAIHPTASEEIVTLHPWGI